MIERLDVVLDDDSLGPTTKVGTLVREHGRSGEVISFEYDDDYLALEWSLAIDPELPLHRGRHHPAPARGLFGAFRDTAPDRWGRVLLERREALEAKQQKRRHRRFDREHGSRRLYASAMTLLCRSDGEGEGSYVDIAEVIQQYGDPEFIESDLAQLYRRVVFSILLANRDDHLRNHGFLRTSGGWRLSPAFDINPNPDKHDHALAIDETDPTPSVSNLHVTYKYYRLTERSASRIESDVRAAVRGWRRVASATKISSSEQRLLADIIQPDSE